MCHRHNNGVQLRFTCTTSLSGNSSGVAGQASFQCDVEFPVVLASALSAPLLVLGEGAEILAVAAIAVRSRLWAVGTCGARASGPRTSASRVPGDQRGGTT